MAMKNVMIPVVTSSNSIIYSQILNNSLKHFNSSASQVQTFILGRGRRKQSLKSYLTYLTV